MESIVTAREYAIMYHGKQMYGKKPYVYHLDKVVQHVKGYGVIAWKVAYLHDIVEDTPVTLEMIENHFGRTVMECVKVITDESAPSRKERKLLTYPKMKETIFTIALVVKAADRLANLQANLEEGNLGLLEMYKSEHEDLREACYRKGLCDHLWYQMDEIINEK